MASLAVIPVGSVPAGMPEAIAEFLAAALQIPVEVGGPPIDTAPAYDRVRGQVDCRRLLPVLEARAEATGSIVLGLADLDLYSAVFTFVFGEARLDGRAGVFSLHRLRPELYGLPADSDLLLARARREAIHETGHLLGLVHCRAADCVMRFSGSAEEVDLKSEEWCPRCRELARTRLARESEPNSASAGPSALGPPPEA